MLLRLKLIAFKTNHFTELSIAKLLTFIAFYLCGKYVANVFRFIWLPYKALQIETLPIPLKTKRGAVQ